VRNHVKVPALLMGAVALLCCAGCATGPTPNPRASTSAVHAEPTPTPTDPQNPANWLVTDHGIGPFILGANLSAVRATQPLLVDTNADCPNLQATFMQSSRMSMAVMTDASGTIVGVEVGNYFMQSAGDAPVASVHTPSGIGLGSTVRDVTVKVPSATLQKFQSDDSYGYYLDKSTNWINFGAFDQSQTIDAIGVWPGTLPPYEWCG
jgi:hypothetical protein